MRPFTVRSTNNDRVTVAEQSINKRRLIELSFDCLDRIFKFLTTSELMSLCTVDELICSAIRERAVFNRIINFNEWRRIWSTEEIFEKIGEQINIMSIEQSNMSRQRGLSPFSEFLSLLIKHCMENHIEWIALNFDVTVIDQKIFEAARPFWKNLRQIQFTAVGRRLSFGIDEFFLSVIDSAEKLSIIQLKDIYMEGYWLQNRNMYNIEKLVLIDTIISENITWQSNLGRHLKLKYFEWNNRESPNAMLCETIVRNCTQLEHFIDYQVCVHDIYLNRAALMNRYNYFGFFENLNTVQITAYMRSGCDLTDAFMALSRKNTVKTLIIDFISNAVAQSDPADRLSSEPGYVQFASLQSLEIRSFPLCYIWNRNIVLFMSFMTNICEVTISGRNKIDSIHVTYIALAAPSLHTLKLYQANVTGEELIMALVTIANVKAMDQNRIGQVFTVFLNSYQISGLQDFHFSDDFRIVEAESSGFKF